MQKSNNTALIIGIVVVIIIVVAAGAWYVNSMHPATAPMSQSATSTPARGYGGTGGMRGGFATGSIEVLNNNGFTLSLADGSTKDVNITATTTLQNYASASSTPTTITPDQLSVGEQVQVIGSPNSDGSIDARMVRTGTFPTGGFGGTHGTRGGGPRASTTQPQVQ